MKTLTDTEVLLLAAMTDTDTAIRMQERLGQGALVTGAALPIKCMHCTRAEVEAMGIVLSDPIDDLFVSATLPDGWSKRGTDHAMWSDLLDAQGRVRANIFYKAAFYDRNAHITLCHAITVSRRWADHRATAALVVRGGAVLFEAPIDASLADVAYYAACDVAEAAAVAWANTHYPDWRDVGAYW